MTWREIKASGRPYYETIRHGHFCRFYRHANGGWSCRISGLGLGIIHEPSKQELWREVNRVTRGFAENPEVSPSSKPRYTDDDIRRHGGVPDVLCGAALAATA